MAVRSFDLIVIGTGVAGSATAYQCRSAGWQVAIIDSQPFGGTCANRGCDPKKVLVGAAELVDWNRRMKDRGVAADGVLDWPALMRFKQTFTDTVPQDREQAYNAAGIVPFHGRAHFIDPESLSLGEDTLKARYFVAAAGARPATLHIPGEEYLVTSTDFLGLGHLPQRIVFIGGGYIGFEFAHIAARAGSEVRIVNRGRPLKAFDPDLVDQLVSATAEIGVEVKTNAAVTAIEKRGDRFGVCVSAEGKQDVLEAEMVVHGAGRVPDIDDLGLQQAGIERQSRGIVVNDYLQSVSNPAVYAAGDAVASGRPLTPSAALEGAVVARNLLEGNHHRPDYRGMASVVFSVPPLAAVGLGEQEARERGFDFEIRQNEDTSAWYNSRRVGATHSGYKVLIEKGSEIILGAHLFGPQADEAINIFALAIRFGSKASEIRQVPFAYPTYSYDVTYMV